MSRARISDRSRQRQPAATRDADPRVAIGEAFLADFLADWREHGATAIAAMRDDKPADYVKLAAALAPKDIRTDPLDELTDAELSARIAELTEQVAADRRPAAPQAGAAATGDDDAAW